MSVNRGVERIDHVDQDERGLQGGVRAIELDLDGLGGERIESHELGGGAPGNGVVEPAADDDDPSLEQWLGRPAPRPLDPAHR